MKEVRREILGLAVAITAPKAVASYLERLLEPFPGPKSGADQQFELRIEKKETGGYLLLTASDRTVHLTVMETINALLAELNRVAIGGLGTPGFHAGVVGMDEEVIAFPAASGAGKSTLTAACLLGGFGYWSDEALVCDRDGRVIPYPRPVMLSASSLELLGLPGIKGSEQPFAPRELGAEVGSGGARLTNMVAIERQAGTGGTGRAFRLSWCAPLA